MNFLAPGKGQNKVRQIGIIFFAHDAVFDYGFDVLLDIFARQPIGKKETFVNGDFGTEVIAQGLK